ncbi:cation transport regulator ChaB [Jiangella aurantiaca]|uniref:Cation transport regulator ChaB n=1 Tax=Jiangella aurantiaca TaxID=2530373 RepID=A0A4R5A0Y9_9ACTN|nr:ChaB family protein [Jiangella aurantiaca]TDD65458.1 cation transport regulator ChaB [Jiangella aurantiaca]
MPAKQDMPSTIRRSPKRAQEIWGEAHDSAVETYGEGERAHRTAFSALKHQFQKVGDHWEPKDGKGPSDPQASRRTPAARNRPRKSAGGVDANASKSDLYATAKKLGVDGRSRMTKDQLVEAIDKENRRQTRQARS